MVFCAACTESSSLFQIRQKEFVCSKLGRRPQFGLMERAWLVLFVLSRHGGPHSSRQEPRCAAGRPALPDCTAAPVRLFSQTIRKQQSVPPHWITDAKARSSSLKLPWQTHDTSRASKATHTLSHCADDADLERACVQTRK